MHAILRGLGVFSLSIFLVGLAHAQEAKEPIARAGQAQAGGSVEPAGVSTTDGKEPIARAGRAQAQGGGALEPSVVSTEGGREPIARGAPGSRRGRPAPSRMVLCRGPRGAVYARDESVGCRNQTLVPGNLVDFGPGRDRGCALRPRMAGSKEAQAVGSRGSPSLATTSSRRPGLERIGPRAGTLRECPRSCGCLDLRALGHSDPSLAVWRHLASVPGGPRGWAEEGL